MNIGISGNRVNNNNSTNFGAKLNLKSQGFNDYVQYMDSCKNAPKGYFNSSKNIGLFKKICKAFEAHPSKEVINADVFYRQGEAFNTRGTLKSSKAKIVDVEPSRSDDGVAPMQNILRKIVDPENKKMFHKLVGKEHESMYNAWWNKNIKPIWGDVKKTFNEGDTCPNISRKQYNKNFRQEVDIADCII